MKCPKSKRYCLLCKKYRTFQYDRAIGHSRCIFCGSNYSKRFSPEDRRKRYCERNNIKYEKPKKEIKIKVKKRVKKQKIKPKVKNYSVRFLKSLEDAKAARAIKRERQS